jgi:sucrose-6-phosphate hydrolase SacC (GH32 family)/outer membrane protein assembly factor BamB
MLVFVLTVGALLAPGLAGAEGLLPKEMAATKGGFVVHLGCGDGTLTGSLRRSDAFIVHGLDTDPVHVRAARERFLAAGLGGKVSAATFDGERLPYVDGMVNLLVVSSRFKVSQAELMRVLAPNGVLLVNAADGWERMVKPLPQKLDEWTHYLRGPDNNAVSKDTAITAPLRHLQWKGSPKYSRHHDKSSSIPAVVSAGGRVFYIVDRGPRASILWDADWYVVARDAFNGVVLWQQKITQWTDQLWPLKSGPAKTPRRLVAVNDAVYVTLGLLGPVSKLDAATGAKLKTYAGTEKTEEVLLDGGVLYLVIHPTIDAAQRGGIWKQTPKKVMAVRESDGAILWQHTLPWIAPVTLTVAGKNVVLCDGPRIIAFDRDKGKKVWESEKLPWREKMPTYFAPTLVAAKNCVLYVGGENWREHAGSKGLLTCLDAGTGKIKWQRPHLPSGYQSPQDIFVIGNSVWCGSLNSKPGEFDKRYPDVSPSTGEFISYDLETGKPGRTIPRGADNYWFHHRCHRAKATENFFLTSRTGIEMIDTRSGKWHLHHWTRGACAYGIMPANGLIYGPPHPCACYPEAKLSGFNALSGPRTAAAPRLADRDRLLKGAAYGKADPPSSDLDPRSDWPTFRANAARSGSTSVSVGPYVAATWRTTIGGKLSQPVVAGGKLLVAAVDAHAVYALDAATGKVQWKYLAGGRVDSPPTLYKGLAIFGSRDGYVYCLRASDGELVWRFQAAPADRRLMAWEQLESVWPVHGSVLIRKDVAYVVAGRSMFLDGGLTLYRLNPVTGELLSKVQMDGNDPNTGKDLHAHIEVLDMPVASSDILSSEGDFLFMRSQPFDLQGKRQRVKQVDLNSQRGDDAHLFVPNGFLDDNYWHRAFWVFGRSVRGGPGYTATGKAAPSGKIMVLDEDNMYVFGRKPEYWRWTTPTEYRLFSVDRSLPKAQGKPTVDKKGRKRPPKPGGFAARWSVEIPLLARAMAKAGDTVFVCGPADIVDERQVANRAPDQLAPLQKQAELFTGSEGSILCAVSAGDGAKIAEIRLDVLPVFDGMIAAGGKLFLSTVDGKVVCLEKSARPPAPVPVLPVAMPGNPNDILIADFEGKDYGGWKKTGKAFGAGPAGGGLGKAQKMTGFVGRGLVNSFFTGDKPTGTLTSPPFKIERRYIHFRIGGGKHPGKTCINLIVDDKVVRTSTGNSSKDDQNRETLEPRSWDVADLAGKTARLQIVDNVTGRWGHINVDHIVLSDRAIARERAASGSRVILDVDFQKTFLPPGWKVEGYAFGSRTPNPKRRQEAAEPSRNQRYYQSGKMTSPEFVIDTDYMEVDCAGVYHPTLCTVRLIVDGKDVRSCSPEAGSGFLGKDQRATKYWFDLRPLKGKKASIEVRDGHANGHLDQVKIIATDRTPPAGSRLITDVAGWKPDCHIASIQGDYLLLPVGPLAGTPLQEVTVEIDGKEKLVVDLPLAFGAIPIAAYLPIYDLTGYQGKPLRVPFHSYDGYEPSKASAKVLMQRDIPGREVSDAKPAFHIHARIGLLNDPNGLFYLNGVYHLFHQYNYNITACSWAHYTSTDLMHWEERPFGVFHDELGSMHSGSAAVDVMNTSGWQEGDIPPVIAAYTGSRGMGGKGDKIQVQCIAYSTDGGRTFTKYEGNPVIGKSQELMQGSDHARDPKLFWFSPTKGRDPYAKDGYWVIVLFEGGSLTIYTSKDLKEWNRHGGVEGFHECPELFPLAVDGDSENVRWIMYGGSGQYHIGSFDGKRFKPETTGKIPMYHDGRCYAAQTFNNTEEGFGGQPRRIQVGWQGGRGGQLSTPTELTLRTTAAGLRVCKLPVKEIANLYTRSVKLDGRDLGPGDANPLADLKGGLYDIDLAADLSRAKQLVLDVRGTKLVIDVTKQGLTLGKMKIPGTRTLSLRVVVDNTSTDVFFGEHGLYYSPRMVKPSSTKALNLTVTGGKATFTKLRVHELKSIWSAAEPRD